MAARTRQAASETASRTCVLLRAPGLAGAWSPDAEGDAPLALATAADALEIQVLLEHELGIHAVAPAPATHGESTGWQSVVMGNL